MKTNRLTTICFGLITIGITSSCSTSRNSSINNLVATMVVEEPIEGVCDNSNVISIFTFPGNGQVKAKAPKTNEEITLELNSKVSFLQDKPDYEDKGMVNLIINCNGELVRCNISIETKSTELDNQIVAVFAEMKMWTAGKLNDDFVDTTVLYSFTIKNGEIILS